MVIYEIYSEMLNQREPIWTNKKRWFKPNTTEIQADYHWDSIRFKRTVIQVPPRCAMLCPGPHLLEKIHGHLWVVVEPYPSEKYKSVGMMKIPINMEKSKHVPVTTNQSLIIISCYDPSIINHH